MGSAGWWGYCKGSFTFSEFSYFRPPGGGCYYEAERDIGEAFVCCQ
jgi:hypothetical protein